MKTLNAVHKLSLLNGDILKKPLQMQLPKKLKAFSQVFMHFWNLDKILNTFKNKMTLIADVFSKLRIPKNVVT